MDDIIIKLEYNNIASQRKAEQITYLSDKLTELTAVKKIDLKQLVYEIDNIGLILVDAIADLTEYINNCDNIIHNLREKEE